MTKQEAIEAMRRGVRITHTAFTDDESMVIVGPYIIFEDGNHCKFDEFWKTRTTKCWEDGYSIWREK